jgi:hypothetical protein
MKQEIALRVLGQVMDWDEERARQEFSWLQLMSKFKYDDYQDYMAGARFVECLADWLQQFKKDDREAAYSFVRSRLIYFGAAELQHMVELVYPTLVERTLIAALATQCGVPAYLIWSTPEAARLYGELLRKCLFFGLSDGARIDVFRRANVGRVSNEQVILATEINDAKWDSLLKDLRESLADPHARFKFVFLLDDFVATGTTLLRKDGASWKGRLPKFWEFIQAKLTTHFEADLQVVVHHFIATEKATENIKAKVAEVQRDHAESGWLPGLQLDYGMVLSDAVRVSDQTDSAFIDVIDRYYDHSIYNEHFRLSGVDHAKLGFGGLGLPIIMEHNTPNNAVALLWAESDGTQGHPMRPLFRRRQRHS